MLETITLTDREINQLISEKHQILKYEYDYDSMIECFTIRWGSKIYAGCRFNCDSGMQLVEVKENQ